MSEPIVVLVTPAPESTALSLKFTNAALQPAIELFAQKVAERKKGEVVIAVAQAGESE